ncbi:MFS transporter [Pseudoalteromonas sp. JC28]|uniref:POT-type proton-dependent oligopeptide transporter n=1 Tax=Pseudoalteromonas sp. JC28 TaxID=2267617 RepID=UPI001574D047
MEVIKNAPISKSVGWILLASCLERLAYYGVRAFIVLFLMDQNGGAGWDQSKTLDFYGQFTMYVYLATFIGGLLSDFLLGAFKSTLLGILLMFFGYLSLGFVESQHLLYSAGLIALGSGFFNPNIPTIIAHQLKKMSSKLDSVFTGQYLVINLGAFIGPMTIGILVENVSWSVAFIMAAAVSALVFIIMYSQRSAVPRQSHKANVATQNQGSNFFSGVGLVIVIFLLSTLFWSYFEIGGGNLYQAFPQIMSGLGFSINAKTVIATCVVCFTLWWFFKVSSWYKVALGFIIFSLSWHLLNYSITKNSSVKDFIIFVMILQAIAEVFCSAIFMSIIAKHGFKPLLSTSYAIFFFATSLASYFAGQYSDSYSTFAPFGWVCLIVGGVLVTLQLSYNKYVTMQSQVE